MTSDCPTCGKTITPIKNPAGGPTKVYCSQSCQQKAYIARRREQARLGRLVQLGLIGAANLTPTSLTVGVIEIGQPGRTIPRTDDVIGRRAQERGVPRPKPRAEPPQPGAIVEKRGR